MVRGEMVPIYIWVLQSVGFKVPFLGWVHIYWHGMSGYLTAHSMEMLPSKIDKALLLEGLEPEQIDGTRFKIIGTVRADKRYDLIWSPAEGGETPWTNCDILEQEFRQLNQTSKKSEKSGLQLAI